MTERLLVPGRMETGQFYHSKGGWVVAGTPDSETHSQWCTSGCSIPCAPRSPLCLCLVPVHLCSTLLLAVPSPGAGFCGPVFPMNVCCSHRDMFRDSCASTGPLPTPAGWIQPLAHRPHFSGHREVGFTVNCAPFAVEPVPLLSHLGHGCPSFPVTPYN